MIVLHVANLVACAGRKPVPDDDVQLYEQADGVVERSTAHGEIPTEQPLSQILDSEMTRHLTHRIQDSISLRRLPVTACLKIAIESGFQLCLCLRVHTSFVYHYLPLLIHARSEDASPYPHHRGTAFHGNLVVVAHSPGTLTESCRVGKILCLHLIEEVGSLHEL